MHYIIVVVIVILINWTCLSCAISARKCLREWDV